MPHVFDPALMSRLDAPERRTLLPPEAILDKAGITSGETVIDVGAGTGFLALPAAKRVGPSGRVLAFDLSPVMVAELGNRAASAGAANLAAAACGFANLPCSDGIADAALLCLVLHESDRQPALLAEIHRTLKPGARICVVEWEPDYAARGPARDERIPPQALISLLGSAGFVNIELSTLNGAFTVAIARCP